MNDWREFSLRIFLAETPDVVFEHWTRADFLSRWFVRAEHQNGSGKRWPVDRPVEEGCRYRWTWANGGTEEGEFTQVEAPSLVAFSFGEGVDVLVRIGVHEERTLLELRQSHSHDAVHERAEVAVDCTQGWTFYLTNLKSILEGGLDLRETLHTDLANVNV